MMIKKGNMSIQLKENVNELNLEIEELLKVKELLIQSSSYKLLYGKTQSSEQKNTQIIRSRLEHSQNISEIAQSIISGIYDECATEEQKKSEIFILNKKKELLYTEICSLAHDLGHTPFGHDGERTINHFMQEINDTEQIDAIIAKRIKCFGNDYEEEQGHIGSDITLSFEHNEQSALIFYDLLHNGTIDLEHIDANRMITAILAHSTTRVPEPPKDLVAQAIRHTDKIEYKNMDFSELGNYIKLEKFKNPDFAQKTSQERIYEIVAKIVKEAIQKGKITDHMDALQNLEELRKSYENVIYFLEEGTKGLLTAENVVRNRLIVEKLLSYYYKNPEQIHTKYYSKVTPLNLSVQDSIRSTFDTLENSDCTNIEKSVNFILSMDNDKIKKHYLKLVRQRIVTGEGVEPITQGDFELVKKTLEEDKIEQFRAKEFAKSRQPHTRKEIRNIIRAKDERFKNEMLTPQGLATIEATKRKIAEEANLDFALCEQMEQADLARKYKREEKIDIAVLDSLIRTTPKLSEEERRHQSAMKVKEQWQSHNPSAPGEDEEGPGGR